MSPHKNFTSLRKTILSSARDPEIILLRRITGIRTRKAVALLLVKLVLSGFTVVSELS